MSDPINSAFLLPKNPHDSLSSVAPELIMWVPLIRAAGFQGVAAGDIAASLQARSIAASPAQVATILAVYRRRPNVPSIGAQLDTCADDIDALKAQGISEAKICLWIALHRGVAASPAQFNVWKRARQAKVTHPAVTM